MTENDIFARLRQIAEEGVAEAPAAPASAGAAPSGALRIDELLKAGQPPQVESDSTDANADRLP